MSFSRLLRSQVANNKGLAALLLIGFVLRSISVVWGIPLSARDVINANGGYYVTDEQPVFRQALKFPGNYLTNPPYVYGSTISYAVGVFCFPFKHLIVAKLGAPHAYEILVVVLMRLSSIMAGTTAILLTFCLAQRLSGLASGYVSAAFCCVAFTHWMNSSYCNLDVWISCLVAANVLYALYIFDKRLFVVRHFARLGILFGILLGTKVPMAVFILFPAGLTVMQMVADGRSLGVGERLALLRRWAWLIGAYATTAVLVYSLTNLHVVLHLSGYVTFMRDMYRTWFENHPMPVGQLLGDWWSKTDIALGTPVALLAVIGVVPWGRERHWYRLLIVGTAVGYYAMFTYHLQYRYVAAVTPLLCVLAGSTCGKLLDSRSLALRAVGAYLTVIALAYSLVAGAAGLYGRFGDARDAALAYIRATFPRGSTFAFGDPDKGNGEWLYPRMYRDEYVKTSLMAQPDFIIVDRWHLSVVKSFMDRELLQEDHSLTEKGSKLWIPHPPQPAAFFEVYERLINETGPYRLVQDIEPRVRVGPEYGSSGLLIYARR
jgi:hypothetical protein